MQLKLMELYTLLGSKALHIHDDIYTIHGTDFKMKGLLFENGRPYAMEFEECPTDDVDDEVL